MKRRLGFKSGLFSALMFITCGRILFYDSQLGLIDLFYSWLTFTGFIVIFYFFYRRKLVPLFLLSYLITAIGVLTKGLPSLAFQAITLLTFFIYRKEFKKLFHWAHFVGILLLIAIVGSYFYIYSRHNSPLPYLKTLVFESTQRTPVEHSLLTTIKHIFIFPFEQLYHIAPWSLLLILFFKKGYFKSLLKDPFIKYCFMIFVSNIILYWISPSTLPRYLFMLYPLAFIIIANAYAKAENEAFRLKGIVITTLNISAILIILTGLFFFHVLSERLSIPFNIKYISLIISLAILAYYMVRLVGFRVLLFVATLLVLCIGFNWFVIPYRYTVSPETRYMAQARNIGIITKNEEVTIYKWSPIGHFSIFYIEKEKQMIINRKDDSSNRNCYYLIENTFFNSEMYVKYAELDMEWKNSTLYLVKFNMDE